MRFVKFSFTNGKVNGRVTEKVEVAEDASDQEIDEALSQWLWERSEATWYEDEPSEDGE